MSNYIITRCADDELLHYGIKGMKWGVRRRIDDVKEHFHRTKKSFQDSTKNTTTAKTNATTHLKRSAMILGGGYAGTMAAAAVSKQVMKRGHDKAAITILKIANNSLKVVKAGAAVEAGMAVTYGVLGITAINNKDKKAE